MVFWFEFSYEELADLQSEIFAGDHDLYRGLCRVSHLPVRASNDKRLDRRDEKANSPDFDRINMMNRI